MSGSSSFAKQTVTNSQHIKTQHDIQNVNEALVLLSILEYRLRPYSRHPLFSILYGRRRAARRASEAAIYEVIFSFPDDFLFLITQPHFSRSSV